MSASNPAKRDVVARFAHVFGDKSVLLQETKDGAAQAESRKRFKGRRDNQQGEQDPGAQGETGEEQDHGGRAERSADSLCESLGRPRDKLGRPHPGASNLTDSTANGEILGPNNTRSQNPAAISTSPPPRPLRRVATAARTTSPAVILAAYSLTGLGKAKAARHRLPAGAAVNPAVSACFPCAMAQG